MEFAASVAFVALAVVAVFQAALALGAPLGAAAWGGKNPGVLPPRLRVVSGSAALVVVHPVVLGAGTPFFPKLDVPIRLRQTGTRTFGSGVDYLGYEAIR